MLDPTPYIDPLRSAYDEHGFVVVRDVFTPDEVQRMREAFDRMHARAQSLTSTVMLDGSQFVVEVVAGEVVIHRIVWCGGTEPILSDLGRDRRLLDIASRLLGGNEFDQLINQAHFKFPGDGVEFPWHQDSRHRRYGTDLWTDVDGRGSFVELVTTVDDMTLENGPIEFIPGSHEHGHVPVDDQGRLPAAVVDEERAVAITAPAGSVIAFGPFVVHGSRPNLGTAPRRSFLNGFALPGANHRVYPGEGSGRRVRLF